MHRKIESFINAHGLLSPGETVVVGVSGGADSVALLDLLAGFRHWPLKLVVAHLNHRLRGADSDADEEFVRQLAARYDVPAVVRSVDVKEFSLRHGQCLEEGGRSCRYLFFDELAAEYGARVAVAHHADDQAETVLMRLIRGSGGTGLSGMRPRSADGRYVRPLLGVSRREIEEYIGERRLLFRKDISNEDTGFLRNRIRHELLPLLATYNPSVSSLLCATATSLAADEEVLEGVAADLLHRHAVLKEGIAVLPVQEVKKEQKGARLRVYRAALRHVKGDLRRIGSVHLEAIDRIVHDARPHLDLDLPGRVTVGTSYGRLSFRSCRVHQMLPQEYDVVVSGPGVYHLAEGQTLSVEESTGAGGAVDHSPFDARFDLAHAPFPWIARTFRNGDRMRPYGMSGTKKVKELFQERKVPREERHLLPLLFCGDTLLWVAGVRRSSEALVTGKTKAVATVRVTPRNP